METFIFLCFHVKIYVKAQNTHAFIMVSVLYHRPCAMVVPDFELIAEIMLVAEGFIEARVLARKFLTLYTLCKELLSKQDHYDWGLRAIKSVLVVAGTLKRGDKGRPEDQVCSLSVCLSVWLPVGLSVGLSVCLSICLSVSVCPSVSDCLS